MIPSTIFELIDNSTSPVITKPEVSEPLFLTAFSSSKGPEELRTVKGDLFYKLYGTDISFIKHGQPLLQANNIIANGGTILAKRVVAEDSTLANLAVVAKVKSEEVQKKNPAGELLYTDSVSGQETTTVTGNTPLMITIANVSYTCNAVEGAKKIDTVETSIEAMLDEVGATGTFTYPLFVVTDNGRGLSQKRIRVSPDYNNSKQAGYMKYEFQVIENSNKIETLIFTMNPDIIEAGTNRSIQTVIKSTSNQLDCVMFEANLVKFLSKVAEISKNDFDYCLNQDILFGKERNSNAMSNIKVDLESEDAINLSYAYGIDLEHGSNGLFNEIPFGTQAYTNELKKFFNGEFSNEIYDLDNYKIDLIMDANYPLEVKKEIEKLATFREDAIFLRDIGIGIRTFEEIKSAVSEYMKNKFNLTYLTSYDILDPFTKKQIPVTITYSLSRLLIEHFRNGRSRPIAGQLHNMVINEAIEGTVNFLPKITPSYNQKELLEDLRVNYASYIDGVLTVETLYTSQELDSQFSYANNVLAIQEVVKALRTRCPKIRYSFITGQDLEKYQEDCQSVLDKYSNNFVTLKLEYLKDETMIANKVYYAAIHVKFKDFVQTEYFKVYAFN